MEITWRDIESIKRRKLLPGSSESRVREYLDFASQEDPDALEIRQGSLEYRMAVVEKQERIEDKIDEFYRNPGNRRAIWLGGNRDLFSQE